MNVTETFLSVDVGDMERATEFYVRALGAALTFASPTWSSLRIAGVRLGLFRNPERATGRVGLHFAVGDLAEGCRDIERAGGRVLVPSLEVAPGVVVAHVSDTEGNVFALRRA